LWDRLAPPPGLGVQTANPQPGDRAQLLQTYRDLDRLHTQLFGYGLGSQPYDPFAPLPGVRPGNFKAVEPKLGNLPYDPESETLRGPYSRKEEDRKREALLKKWAHEDQLNQVGFTPALLARAAENDAITELMLGFIPGYSAGKAAIEAWQQGR